MDTVHKGDDDDDDDNNNNNNNNNKYKHQLEAWDKIRRPILKTANVNNGGYSCDYYYYYYYC